MGKRLYRLILLSLLVLLTILQPKSLIAQKTDLQPVYTSYTLLQNLIWSSDSRILAFQEVEAGLTPLETGWHAYNISANSLSVSNSWILQPTLNASIQQKFNLSDNPTSTDRIAFLFPNGQYIVTPGEADKTLGTHNLIVVDLQTNKAVLTSVPGDQISADADRFGIHWSGNSETFVASISAAQVNVPAFFERVTGYSPETPKIDVQDIIGFMVGDRLYGTLEIYDVSLTGDRVLLHGRYDTPSPTNRQTFFPLIVWNANNQHQVLLDQFNERQGDLLAASFAPDDENYILVVDDRGLVRYSLRDGKLEILRPEINSERFHQALFSPDGQSLALVETVGKQENLYIVENLY